jgi:6-phosphogluconolactonase
MELAIFGDAAAVADAAAAFIATEAQGAVAARGRCVIAVSGGHTPSLMLRSLAGMDLPWGEVHLVQVDERVAPEGHPDRNLTQLQESLLARVALRPEQVHAMPVDATDLEDAVRHYSAELRATAGAPPVLDLVHLGLGLDGHTASLVPGDTSLDVIDTDVALTAKYQGRRRMTLTYPAIDRARRILWVVTGADKAAMVRRLLESDRTIPAGRVSQERAVVFADRAAATLVAAGRGR